MRKLIVFCTLLMMRCGVSQRQCNLFCDEGEDSVNPLNRMGRSSLKGEAGAPGKRGGIGSRGEKGVKGDSCDVDCDDLGRLVQNVPRLESIIDAQTRQNLPRSCLEVRNNGLSVGNGVYYIRDGNNIEYPVYCDMSIDSGGWTLVASVHENDARRSSGKCTAGDRWSSQLGNHPGSQTGANAWFDYQIFGNVLSATSDDYKNAAYFDQKARNIMIWQVPNDTPLQNYSSASYLQYRTSNGFLSRYEGNLFSLYKKFFPMKSGVYTKVAGNGPAVPVVFDKGNGVVVMESYGDNVKPHIDTGYIEFRAVNNERSVYAMCPGTKAKSTHVNLEHSCIGSSADNAHVNYCGDFSGYVWDGYGTGNGWNADLRLLESTYLIFYR